MGRAGLLMVPLALAACGHGETSARVPDVRGQRIEQAAAHLVDARLCVKLKLDRTLVGGQVQRERPAAGASLRRWAPVTIVAGLPRPHAAGAVRVVVDVAVAWGGGKSPCPPVTATLQP